MRTIALAVMAVTAISFSLNVTALNAKESDGRAGNW